MPLIYDDYIIEEGDVAKVAGVPLLFYLGLTPEREGENTASARAGKKTER